MTKLTIFSVLFVLLSLPIYAQEFTEKPAPDVEWVEAEESVSLLEAAVAAMLEAEAIAEEAVETDSESTVEEAVEVEDIEWGDFINYPYDEAVQDEVIKSVVDLPKASDKSIVLGFEGVRALDELNTADDGEAYPWISNDGLRIYYNGKGSNILYASRPTTQDPFQEKQELFSEFSMDLISVWLNSNETEIYFVSRESDNGRSTTLYSSKRSSRSDHFPQPTKVSLLGEITGFVSAPSLTEDGNTLYIYNAHHWQTLVLTKTADNTFTLSHSLPLPEGNTAGPGQLSMNGLHYYLSIEDREQNSKGIYVYQRERTDQPFEDLYYIDNNAINKGQRNHQPGVSNNGKYMAFTRSTANFWDENDLYIAYNSVVKDPNVVDPLADFISISDILESKNLVMPPRTCSEIVNVSNLNDVRDAGPIVIPEPIQATSETTIVRPENTSTEAAPIEIKAAVFPNPTRDYINFRFFKSGTKLGSLSLTIYAMDGRQVESIEFESSETLRVPVTTYSAGMYTFSIFNSSGIIQNGRFIVQ